MEFLTYKQFRESPKSAPIRKDYSIKAQIEPDESRVITFTASTGAVDRMGDVIYQTGWKIDNFMKNPVVLFGHDSDDLPVGHVKTINFNDSNLTLSIDFTPKDIYPFAETVFQMIKRGDLSAGSVGMKPIKWKWVEDSERNGIDFIEQELLEFSIVTIPANPEALSHSNKGIIDADIDTTDIIKSVDESFDKILDKQNKINIQKLVNRVSYLKNCHRR